MNQFVLKYFNISTLIIFLPAAQFFLLNNCLPLSLPLNPKIQVQGHQGARAKLPGNTIPSFEYALSKGVDVLELDVVVSKDKKLVVDHDHFLGKEFCLSPDGKTLVEDVPIISLNYEEIKKYDCGTLTMKRFPEQKSVPRTPRPLLEDVIALVKKPGNEKIMLNIETKLAPGLEKFAVPPKEFSELLFELLRKENFLNRAYIQSFDFRTLKEFKKLYPNARLVALFEGNTVDYASIARSVGAEIISPNHQWIATEDVGRIRSQGIQVVPWTANSKEDIQRLIEMKVDGIISDDPELVIKLLSGQN